MNDTTTNKPRAKRKVQIAAPVTTTHPFRDVMRAGVPLVQYETSDPAATMRKICHAMNGEFSGIDLPAGCRHRAVIEWDCLRSVRSLNEPGKAVASLICGQDPQSVANPVALLAKLDECNNNASMAFTVIFMHNAHRFIDDVAVMQGVWNLRNPFKRIGACLVMLCPNGKVPLELKQDLMTLTDPLPDSAELSAIVRKIATEASKSGATFDPDEVSTDGIVIDTLRGLSPFGAEQVTAMSVRKDRLDSDTLWERKKRMIEQTPGLAVWQGGETFLDIGGCGNIKAFLSDVLKGQTPPRAVVWLDEIEKSMAGTGTDSSGVSQDYLRCLLSYMQDKEVCGVIFVGPPGSAKSAIAKACGTEGGIPTIALDMGGMKASLVGESESRLRGALQVIDAVSESRPMFIATCNSLAILPPELKRRFTFGTFFFPLPTEQEREMIWGIYESKYKLDKANRPTDAEWSGAEIKQCCQIAWRLGRTQREAAKFIVPVSVSSADAIAKLCRDASNKFISASKAGVYTYNDQHNDQQKESRTIQLR